MFKFLKHSLSMDEFKVSALIICLFVTMGTAAFAYFKFGDITANWLTLLQTLIISVGGVNAISAATDLMASSRTRQDDESDGR